MIIKNKNKIDDSYEFVTKIADYYFMYKDKMLYINGVNLLNLSKIKRTPISIEVRKGSELTKENKEFYTDNYNIDSDAVYYIVGILLDNVKTVFIFDTFDDASLMQYTILGYKSNLFFAIYK